MLDSGLVAKIENMLIGGHVCTENVDKTGKIILLSETTAKVLDILLQNSTFKENRSFGKTESFIKQKV